MPAFRGRRVRLDRDGGRSTLKWPHCSSLIWPRLGPGRRGGNTLIWPHRGFSGSDTPGGFRASRYVWVNGWSHSVVPAWGGADGTGQGGAVRQDPGGSPAAGLRGAGAGAPARGAPADGAGGAGLAGAGAAEGAGAAGAGAGAGRGTDRGDAAGGPG